MIKRISLFLLTNLLVVTTVSIMSNLLGLHSYLNQYGIDYGALAKICLLWGMGSAFISLLLSRWMAKTIMQVHLISPTTSAGQERKLLETVYHYARQAGLNTMPQVGLYQSKEVNAFATGPTRNRALVAISSGLLQRMKSEGIDGVLAHEISHIANGDMVTMTLLQGIVNAFSIFISRVIAYFLQESLYKRSKHNTHSEWKNTLWYSLIYIILDICITLLGSLLVAAFSRHREYRADYNGAKLAGRQKMITALEELREIGKISTLKQDTFASSLKIAGPRRFLALLATHPEIDQRIAAIKAGV